MIFAVLKVVGHSMLPSLKPTDKVIVSSLPYFFSKQKIGDVIIFKKDKKVIVKRIVKIEKEKIQVAGDNKNDSAYNLTIEKHDILGKVIYRMS